jgi:ABC-2 type transport system ATP-binding protein
VCDRVQIISQGELVLNESISGLERHMKAASITVAFHQAPPLAELEKIEGVTSVKQEHEGRLHLFHDAHANPTEKIIQLAAQKNWGLYEIRPGRVSLEQIFVELTAVDKLQEKMNSPTAEVNP